MISNQIVQCIHGTVSTLKGAGNDFRLCNMASDNNINSNKQSTVISNYINTNTGASQGCALSLILFIIIYLNKDCSINSSEIYISS